MNEHRIIRPRMPRIPRGTRSVVVAVLALVASVALIGMQVRWTAHAAPQVPQTGNWEQQAPYPTRFATDAA